jgi:hypothetical protein
MATAARVPTSPVPPPHRGERLVTVYPSTPAASAGPAYRQALIEFQKTVFAWPKGYPLGISAYARIVSWNRLVVPTGRFQHLLRATTTDPIPASPKITKAERHRLAQSDDGQYEELRLLYVAVTRAKQLLWLCRHGAPSPSLALVSGSREPRTIGMPTPRPQGWLRWLAQYFSGGRGA